MDIPKISQVAMLVEVDNFAQVELYGQIILLEKPNDPHALVAVAWANLKAGLLYFTVEYLRRAGAHRKQWPQLATDLFIPNEDLVQLQTAFVHEPPPPFPDQFALEDRYLLIKAWGYGFWSDVLHVLGGLMLAEISNRLPVVYWGANSLYSTRAEENAFNHYFEQIGPSIDFLTGSGLSCYPPKWRGELLSTEDVNKIKGSWSKISGLHLMGREEPICVMDYYIGVLNLMPYIGNNSAMTNMNIDQVYQYLIDKYLKLKPEVVERTADFHQQHLGSTPYLAVHVRGSDKVGEFKVVDKFHNKYQELISQQLQLLPPDSKIFLMTDDNRLLTNYLAIYGDRIVTTDCLRTDNQTGVHYQAKDRITQSANEVIVDTLIASQASRFVGNGYSNPSIFVYYLGEWKETECLLIGGNRMHHYNTHLYKTIDVI